MSTASNYYGQPSAASETPRILIADDEVVVREVLARKLQSLGYVCECCATAGTAIGLLRTGRFDLVLADVFLPGIGEAALLREALDVAPGIAVILMTSAADIETAVDALKDGAYDYITKPFNPEQVSMRVSRALEKRHLLLENEHYQRTLEEQVASRTRQLTEALEILEHTYHSTLVALSKTLDSRDAYSDGHSLRVTVYTRRLAQQLKLTEPEIKVIEQGVLLHDIGKIGIPDELLRKNGHWSGHEWDLMRRHPETGYRILSSIKFLKDAAQVVLHHHERYDGRGYPQGLKGGEIHLGARIFGVCDALDDLTSLCEPKTPVSFEEAAQQIGTMSGSQLDPAIVREFHKIPVSDWKALRREIAAKTKRADFLRL